MIFPKKDRDKDIEEIKKAMDKNIGTDIPDFDVEELPSPKKQMIAPLFVKVEKYRELLTTVHEMKLFVSGVKQIFSILQELETIRSEALKVMRASVQRLERSVLEMDTELLRPRGVDFTELVEREADAKHIEDSLTELQNQVKDLRRDLQSFK